MTTTDRPPADDPEADGRVPTVDRWTDRVRKPRRGARRNLGAEWRVFREAQARLREDTTDMQAVFEVLQNFPMSDLLRWHTRWLNPLVREPAFEALFSDRSMPDLTDETARDMLAMPEGTLGREYGEFVRGWGLDNQFLDDWELVDAQSYLGFRTAHIHDLLHFLLGYPPHQHSGEMEIEAFLYAQTGSLNHLLFIAGFARRLRRQRPAELRRILPRLPEAYRRGRRCANVMLVRWEEQLHRPLDAVRAELGIDDRRVLPRCRIRPRRPRETPKLAHVVFNTPDLQADTEWFERVFGLEVSARDERFGVTFLTDGTDHHTVALGKSWRLTLPGIAQGVLSDLRTARMLLQARRSGPLSSSGAPLTFPPMSVIREHIRPGLGHLGYRVSCLEELEAWFHHLEACGVGVDWAVNHGDMISGIYFLAPNGIRCEIFTDGPQPMGKVALRDTGATLEEHPEDDFHNWDLELDRWR